MCGRFTLTTSGQTLAAVFDITEDLDLKPRYNIAPTQSVLVLKADDRGRHAEEARWGLVPPGAANLSVGPRMINARSETAHELPAFRRPFRMQRCLVPATGWYEWSQGERRRRDPWWFHLADGSPFGMAGLWEQWRSPDGELIQTCTVLTMDAVWGAHIHDRMPVVLPPDVFEDWLDPDLTDPGLVADLIRPWSEAPVVIDPVRHEVNDVRNDDPRCIEPRPTQQSLF